MFFLGNKKSQDKNDKQFDVVDDRSSEGHCFISGNVHISGEVKFGGTLRIDGRVDGKISVYSGKKGTLILSGGAFINGPVDVTNLVTDGTIHGDVDVENRMECRAHSLIKGEMNYGSIQIVEGAQLVGKCTQRSSKHSHILNTNSSKRGILSQGTGEISLATRSSFSLRKNS